MDRGHLSPDKVANTWEARVLAEAHNFDALIASATSIHRSRIIVESDLEGNDLLTSVWRTLQGTTATLSLNPWKETDRLIVKARDLEQEAVAFLKHLRQTCASSVSTSVAGCLEGNRPRTAKRKRPSTIVTSHYWGPTDNCLGPTTAVTNSSNACEGYNNSSLDLPKSLNTIHPLKTGNATTGLSSTLQTTLSQNKASLCGRPRSLPSDTRRGTASPYFTLPHEPQPATRTRRLPAGTVSCIPFPPLTSSSFGLIQERFAHEPFWLLVAVTFLIRTKGTAAVPVLLSLKDRFPTPEAIADAANTPSILDLIRHLGLAKNRMRILQKYARLFIDQPPHPETVYRVKKYESREFGLSAIDDTSSPKATIKSRGLTPSGDKTGNDPEAWEIGHMTQGKYAIDSWRIFCRDELLGRAGDWKGMGREPGFQPEWMRVMPDDKELRAYLRWMWMGEGWEWNPLTGDKKPLREEMLRAVNDGNVEYDDGGGLRIILG